MFLPIFLSQLAIYVCVLAAPTGSDNQGLLIKTTSGTVQGIVNATTPNVRQFLGIPYAEPPIGALRFAAPQAKSASTAIINATKLPASCMQQFSNSSTIYTAVVSQFLIHGGQSEDCLYVSVWAPLLNSIVNLQVPLPVFLYIPSGGITSGGQDSLV